MSLESIKGTIDSSHNHIGIALLSVPGKMYARILEQKLTGEIESVKEHTTHTFSRLMSSALI